MGERPFTDDERRAIREVLTRLKEDERFELPDGRALLQRMERAQETTMTDPIERLKTIRGEVWTIKANGGWGDGRLLNLAERIYDMCVEVVGKELNDKELR